MRPVLFLIIGALLVGCASGPKTSPSGEPLSELDAQRCELIAGMANDLATLRERNVGRRKAIKQQLKAADINSLDRSERKTAISDIYVSAIFAYAIPDFSSSTLEAFRWSECKIMALHGNVLDYSDIIAIKIEVVKCQTQFEKKSAKKLKACITTVVKDRSRDANPDAQIEKRACQKLVKSTINLHKEAVRLVKKKSTEKALGLLEETVDNWKKIAGGSLSCSDIDNATAADGILRATRDISSISVI